MAGDGTSDATSVMKTLREIMQDQHDDAPQPQRENWLAEEKPAKVSLMALLADEDGYSDSDVAEAEEGQGRVEKAAAEGQIESVCCVCMVRNKGAAFIPCGHTFCRLCSRELWVCRGNCPLCNGFIHEILDIF